MIRCSLADTTFEPRDQCRERLHRPGSWAVVREAAPDLLAVVMQVTRKLVIVPRNRADRCLLDQERAA